MVVPFIEVRTTNTKNTDCAYQGTDGNKPHETRDTPTYYDARRVVSIVPECYLFTVGVRRVYRLYRGYRVNRVLYVVAVIVSA